MGTASGIGMFMAPFLIKFFGKRNVAIFSNIIMAAASALLIIFPSNVVLLFISTYIVFWGAAVQIISQPAMNADALDYQQYATGDRFHESVLSSGENFDGTDSLQVEMASKNENDADCAEVTSEEVATQPNEEKEV